MQFIHRQLVHFYQIELAYPNIKDYDVSLLPGGFLRHRRSLRSSRALPPAAASPSTAPIAASPASTAARWTVRRRREAREPSSASARGAGHGARGARARGAGDRRVRRGAAPLTPRRRRPRRECGGRGGAGGRHRTRCCGCGEEEVVRGGEEGGLGAGGGDGLGESEEGRGGVHPSRSF